MTMKQAGLAMLGLVLGGLSSTFADTYYQSANDGGSPAQSSINDSSRWWSEPNGSGTKAPSAPSNTTTAHNNYITNLLLRTPNNANNYTFNADSLTINSGGSIFFKAVGPSDPVTYSGTSIINTLTFTGTLILNEGAALDQNTATSGSNWGMTQVISATAGIQINGSSTIRQSQGLATGTPNATMDQKTNRMIIDAPISGNGALQITNATANTAFDLTFKGNNSGYSGNMTISTTFASSGSYRAIVHVAAGSSLGTGAVTVGQNGTLMLESSLGNSNITVNSGGILTAQSGGSLGVSVATVNTGGILTAELGSSLGTGVITMSGGTLTLNDANALLYSSGLVISNNGTVINLTLDTDYYLQSYTAFDGTIYGINDYLGQTIGGTGSGADIIDTHILGSGVFLISAIPEPSTYVLIGIGLLVLSFLRKNKPLKVKA
jgi:hypothetical protein